MVVLTHTKNFSILTLLESAQKSGELNRLSESFRPPKGWRRVQFKKFENAQYKTVVQTHSQSFSTLA